MRSGGAAVGAALPLVGLLGLRDEGRLALHRRVVGLGEVGRPAPQLRHDRSHGAEDLAGGGPRRDALGVGREGGQGLGQPRGQFALDEPVEQGRAVRVGPAPGLVGLVPLAMGRLAADLDLASVRQHWGVDLEGLGRVEAQQLLHALDLGIAEGGAVGLARALLGRGRPRDDGVEANEGGALGLPALGECGVEGVDVLGVVGGAGRVVALAPVDVDDIPAVCRVARGDVLAEGDVGVVLDRDLIGVVDDGQVAEFLVAGQR